MRDITDPVLDALYAHNFPEPCLLAGCPFCTLWDTSTTEQFVRDVMNSLPMLTEVKQ